MNLYFGEKSEIQDVCQPLRWTQKSCWTADTHSPRSRSQIFSIWSGCKYLSEVPSNSSISLVGDSMMLRQEERRNPRDSSLQLSCGRDASVVIALFSAPVPHAPLRSEHRSVWRYCGTISLALAQIKAVSWVLVGGVERDWSLQQWCHDQ